MTQTQLDNTNNGSLILSEKTFSGMADLHTSYLYVKLLRTTASCMRKSNFSARVNLKEELDAALSKDDIGEL